MRIYEGNYGYEVESITDAATQLRSGWRYNVYRLRPIEELVRSGEASTREAAEEAGRRAMEEAEKAEAQKSKPRKNPAA